MFKRKDDFKPFASKVWLASPTMHGEELKYVTEAYETNWMSTVAYFLITIARFELYTSLERGLKDIQEGNTRPLSVALSDLRWRRKK